MALSAIVLQEVLEQVCIVLQSKDVVCSTEELHKALTEVVSHKKSNTPSLGEGTCVWAASNGKNQGVVCGKQVLLGQQYCKTCYKKPSVQRKLQGGGGSKSVVKTTSIFGAKKTTEPPPPRKYNLIPIEELPAHFYVPSMHYIVRKEPNDTYLVIGCGENKVERPLSEEEKEKALSLGLRVLENSKIKPQKFADDEDLPDNLE